MILTTLPQQVYEAGDEEERRLWVAEVDVRSGGRLRLAIGGGWNAALQQFKEVLAHERLEAPAKPR